ncbi:MAG: hypothetical protein DMF68_05420 [Acidobacteria bacterium]|nr:MAG: hypothetical protein DMF68_05420 [Acidobacteriota bacterium]
MALNPKDIPYHYYSLDEYFALEQASDARFEYWDGDIICMSGGSRAHYIISGNVFYRLRQRLEGGPCRAFTADTAILTPALPPYRYPDASVACSELKFKHVQVLDALVNPVLIVEVLSPSTASLDHNQKFSAYKAIETFSDYLLISQDKPLVTHYSRQPDGKWMQEEITSLDASLTFASIGCTINVREIYEDVDFLEVNQAD